MASGSGSVANRVVVDRDTGVMTCPRCHEILNDERSEKHLRMLNAFLTHVVKHWPTYGPDGTCLDDKKPTSKEQLRAMMLVRVDHCEPDIIYKANTQEQMKWAIDAANAFMAAERKMGRYSVATVFDGGIAVRRPASIAMHGKNKISEKQFCQITEKVFDLIAMETGIVLEKWKKSGRRK
jgi:hypothetical protein